jgi:hypothetical protein
MKIGYAIDNYDGQVATGWYEWPRDHDPFDEVDREKVRRLILIKHQNDLDAMDDLARDTVQVYLHGDKQEE